MIELGNQPLKLGPEIIEFPIPLLQSSKTDVNVLNILLAVANGWELFLCNWGSNWVRALPLTRFSMYTFLKISVGIIFSLAVILLHIYNSQ